ncbi:MAG: acyl-CoA dehydrogenase family protein [Acidimicrobiia bacterium]
MADTTSDDEILDGLRAFLEREVVPRHEANNDLFADGRSTYVDGGRYDDRVVALLREVRMASAAAGYYTMFVPEALGGAGLTGTLLYDVWELIFRTCGAHHWLGHHAVAHWARGPSPALALATAEMRESVLPRLLAGEWSMCFAMSEPDAGTDLWMMKTTAEPDGDGWRISGVKQWITNGPYADVALVFAVTDAELLKRRKGGISAFLVPTSTPGFVTANVIRMFGKSGGDEAVFHMDNVRVEPHQLVGELHRGLAVGQTGIGIGRIFNAAKGVGLGRWALAHAVEHVRHRVTFGQPVSERQGVMFPIAESTMELHAARLTARDAASHASTRGLNTPEVAMAKAYATEAGLRAAERAMQAHGASGLTNEVKLVYVWQELRKGLVADGSAELMRRNLGRWILNGDVTL